MDEKELALRLELCQEKITRIQFQNSLLNVELKLVLEEKARLDALQSQLKKDGETLSNIEKEKGNLMIPNHPEL